MDLTTMRFTTSRICSRQYRCISSIDGDGSANGSGMARWTRVVRGFIASGYAATFAFFPGLCPERKTKLGAASPIAGSERIRQGRGRLCGPALAVARPDLGPRRLTAQGEQRKPPREVPARVRPLGTRAPH